MGQIDSVERRERLQRDMGQFMGRLNDLKDPRTPRERRLRAVATRGLHARLRALIELDNKTLKN